MLISRLASQRLNSPSSHNNKQKTLYIIIEKRRKVLIKKEMIRAMLTAASPHIKSSLTQLIHTKPCLTFQGNLFIRSTYTSQLVILQALTSLKQWVRCKVRIEIKHLRRDMQIPRTKFYSQVL